MKRQRFWLQQLQQVWLSALGVVLILAALPGCRPGSPVGEVTGRVTIDGQPAPGLLVHFEPQEGFAKGLPETEVIPSSDRSLPPLPRPNQPSSDRMATGRVRPFSGLGLRFRA